MKWPAVSPQTSDQLVRGLSFIPIIRRRARGAPGDAALTDDLRIELLADHPEVIPVLKSWFEREWAPYYGPDGSGDAERDLRESCNRDELPIALVALWGDQVCGTAAVKTESVTTRTHLTPWLAALLVGAGYRRRGVGEQLIAAVEERARRLGFAYLYVGSGEGSGTPETALRKRGWEFVKKSPYYASEVSIFRKAL
jgi:GNAT superfamily N-acetyltransferase